MGWNFNDVELESRKHYRIVFGTVGYGIERFRGTKELLHSTYDVFTGASPS